MVVSDVLCLHCLRSPEYKAISPELHCLDPTHREYPGFQLYGCIFKHSSTEQNPEYSVSEIKAMQLGRNSLKVVFRAASCIVVTQTLNDDKRLLIGKKRPLHA